MLTDLKALLKDAREKHYAVPAFDVSNYEMIRAVIETCAEERSPCIFMTLKPDLEGNGLKLLSNLMKTASEIYKDLPVCIHLDHATSFDDIKAAIDAGYTSVMFDGSVLPFEENVKRTKEVVDYVHVRNISVEAELGHVADAVAGSEDKILSATTNEDIEKCMTDVGEAKEFIERTGVDCLAVAIGTAHGVYVSAPVLQFKRLSEINAQSSVPLVMHGGSGTPDKDVQKAISLGITKINIYSEVLHALNSNLKEKLNSISNLSMWPVYVYENSYKAMKEVIRKKIRTFGSNGRI